jgi:pimeloyl-ACP methyl ester carboxylesterase
MRLLPTLFAAVLIPVASSSQTSEIRRISSAPGDTVVTTSFSAVRATNGAEAGAPVVLVPGLLGAAYTFRNLAPALAADGHRVVIIEPLGVGTASRPKDADYSLEAQAARIGYALDSLGIHNATLVCHSVGASMCMRLTLQRPALAHGIISLNGGPDEAAATGGLRSALRMAPLLKLFGAQRIIKGKVKDGLRNSSADPAWVTDAVLAGYTTPFANFNAVLTSYRGMVNAKERAALKPRLSQISVPMTIMVGAGKPGSAISPEDLQTLVRSVPQLKVDSVAGAGQYIQEEKPEAIVKAVREQQRIR